MKKTLIIISSIIVLSSYQDHKAFEKGRQQLETQGYTNIQNTGYSAFCCDDKDTFSTGFKATDKKGNTVKGCFCSGLFKGITIRFE